MVSSLVDSPFAKACGLSLRTRAQTMLYLSLIMALVFKKNEAVLETASGLMAKCA